MEQKNVKRVDYRRRPFKRIRMFGDSFKYVQHHTEISNKNSILDFLIDNNSVLTRNKNKIRMRLRIETRRAFFLIRTQFSYRFYF